MQKLLLPIICLFAFIQISNAQPVITSLSPSASLCQDGAVAISFTASGMNAGNIFTAELSNSSGSFASPVAIGTWNSTTGGVINAAIPAAQTAGSGYRIRVVSSSPAQTSADNGTNLTINARPVSSATTVTPSGTQTICQGALLTLSAPANAAMSYQWQLAGTNITGATANTYDATQQGYYNVVVSNASGCSRTSASKVVNVTASPAAMIISPAADTAVCTPASISFAAAAATGNTYQWQLNGAAISGATSSSCTATSIGAYTVAVTKNSCTAISPVRNVTAASCNATAPVITSVSPPANLCQGAPVVVSFTASGMSAGNVYTVELSNSSGSFAAPIVIGTLTSSAGSGTITANIPQAQAPGVGYRIRIVSSSPALTGNNNSTNLTVAEAPTAAEATLCTTSCSFTLCQGAGKPLTVPNPGNNTYQWKSGGNPIPGATNNSYLAQTAGSYSVVVTKNGCSITSPAPLAVSVVPCDPVITSLSPSQKLCQGQPVAVSFTIPGFNNGSDYTVQLSNYAGSFSSPLTIGTISNSIANSITINAFIPSSAAIDTGYRIRIIRTYSSVQYIGPDNGYNLSIGTVPSASDAVITPSGPTAICPGSSVTLSAPVSPNYTYQWLTYGLGYYMPIAGATNSSYTVSSAGLNGTYYILDVTNAAGCSRRSSDVWVTMKTAITVTVSPSTPQSICPGGSLLLTSSGAAYYQWQFNGTAIPGATNQTYTATAAGDYAVTATGVGSNLCPATSTPVNVIVSSSCADPVITALNPSTYLCKGGNLDVSFTASGAISGNAYIAELSNASGSFSSPTTIGSLNSTANSGTINCTVPSLSGTGFRVRVRSTAPALTGLDNGNDLVISSLPTTAQAAIGPSGTQTVCPGSTVTLTVPVTASFSYQWLLGGSPIAGATNPTYNAGTAGAYSAVVTNPGFCSRTSSGKQVNVTAAPNAVITSPSSPQSICGGGTVLLTAAMGSGQTYQWTKDGTNITGATASTYTASTVGTYAVAVTKNGCSGTSAPVAITGCGALITTTGVLSRCTGDTITVAFSATANAGNIYTLQLSDANGGFGNAVTLATSPGTGSGTIAGIIPAGTPAGTGYKLRINTSSPLSTGTPSGLTVAITGGQINPVSLCAVTVDSATGKNKLIWDKPMVTGIDTFVFYRRSNTSAAYDRIGAQAYNLFSTWIDAASDPLARANRYYLTAKNNCYESAPADTHRTMHLSINKGRDNNTWNLIWNGYEGVPHDVYNIYRGATNASLTLLTTIEANVNNSFTDYNAPAGAIYYMVSVADGPACNPSLRTTEGGTNWITSNIARSEEALPWADLKVYPNPAYTAAGSELNVLSSNVEASFSIRIIDVSGRIVELLEAKANQPVHFGEGLSLGLYTIEATDESGRKLLGKWVKL